MSTALKWLDKNLPVIANAVYDDGVLVGQNVKYTCPLPKWQTVDIEANGTYTVPLVGRADNMQLSITHVGVDKAWAKTNTPENHKFEFRNVQPATDVNGTTIEKSVKMFVNTGAPSVSDIGVELGSASELENTYPVTRIAVYVEGEEIYMFDRLTGTLRVNGKDYSSKVQSML